MSGTNMKSVLVVALAALFVLAFAYQASAISAGGSTPFTYTGTIVSIDNGARVVSVQSNPESELSFSVTDHGRVMKCDMAASFTDLKPGDRVTVSYFEKGTGSYVASEIDLVPTGMNKC